MERYKCIAAVTGATGMIGKKVVRRLVERKYKVRILSRRSSFNDPDVELYVGGLEDEGVLNAFLNNAHLLFHCAAELYDESKMWDVNVVGTHRLLRMVKDSSIDYLCYLSSAGVVGRTSLKWVGEETACNPQNAYEKSKWAAEQIVAGGIDGCRVVILRPTNVIDNERPGALGLPMGGSLKDRLKVFLKGGECAHIVHAEDVADASIYLMSHLAGGILDAPRRYFVSCDHEPLNTFAGLWTLYKTIENNRRIGSVRPVPHLPLIAPHILRQLRRGKGNRGDVRYSSEKLISEGFKFHLGVEGAVRKIIANRGPEQL